MIYPSLGPLPERLAHQYAGSPLVFCDASLRRHGGLAVVMFAAFDAEPLVSQRTVPAMGSNALELRAALFGLKAAGRNFPGQSFALFSDNQDAVIRLSRAKEQGLAQDAELANLLAEADAVNVLALARIVWIKGHSSCRGNILADQAAAEAAV